MSLVKVRELVVLASVFVTVLNGCSQLGPGRIELGRGHYNVAVQQTENEQMLLNLVRLRYRDTPYFLQVASVSTNFEFTVSTDASASLKTGPDVYGLGIGATATRDADGQPFDWKQITGDLMQIRSSLDRPESSAVRVQYRGSWFYIDDSDLTSKSTFALLMNLFALQAGDIPTTAPVLTLPVAR